MTVQDDVREQQMVMLFNLSVADDRGRADIDAYLNHESSSKPLPFELKSTSKTSVSTVRDFGPQHIAKWATLHWLFAFYDRTGSRLKYCYYASPADMADWIAAKEDYVLPDMLLAERAPTLVNDEVLDGVFGPRSSYSLADAQSIMKRQWTVAEYLLRADLDDDRFSRIAMTQLLAERGAYLIRRGATLNNPHIAESYLVGQGLRRIDSDHAAVLRHLVGEYLASGKAPTPVVGVIANQANASMTAEPTA